MNCLRNTSSTAAAVLSSLLVVFFVGVASAEDVGQAVFDELLRASHDARVLRSRAAIQQAAEEGIGLGPWYSVGPFKDEAYGNLVQSFEHEFTPQRDVLAAGNDLVDLKRVYVAKKLPAMLDTNRPWIERAEWCDGYRHLLPRGPAPSRNETIYLYRTIEAKKATTKTMRLYAEDFVESWLDGKSLGRAVRNYGPHRYPVPLVVKLPLMPGKNRLLVKITSMYGAHGFAFGVDGVTTSNSQEPLQASSDLIADASRSNFYPGNVPFATAEPATQKPATPADQESCLREIADSLTLDQDIVREVFVGSEKQANTDDTDKEVELRTAQNVHDRVQRLEHALRLIRGTQFDVTMVPMFDPPRSKMDEMLAADYPTSPMGEAYIGALAALSGQVAEAMRSFEQGDHEAAEKVVAAAEALDAMWSQRIRELDPIVFLRCPAFGINAIAPYTSGGSTPASICVFDPSQRDRPPRVVFHEPGTAIFDMNLSYDARTIFFSAKRPGTPDGWHIYEMGVDGTKSLSANKLPDQNVAAGRKPSGFAAPDGLRRSAKSVTYLRTSPRLKQITSGDSNNISPLLLPSGQLMFVSDRANTWVQCQGHRSGLLYTSDRDGSRIRKVSANIDSDHSPQIMNDGRVLFTRWDYGIEKNVFARHALWSMNPDGTRLELFYGNTIEDPGAFWEARAIPGRPEVACAFGPHHSYHAGMVGLVWNRCGPEAPRGEGFRFLTSEIPVYCDVTLPHGYQDIFPINERLFLVSYGGDGAKKNRLYLLDDRGNRRCVYEAESNLGCWNPMLLRSRKVPPVLTPPRDNPEWTYREPEEMNTSPDDLWGTFMVQDVYRGLQPHIQRGQAKYLQVIEQVQKSRRMAGGEAWGHTPIIGRGTVHVRRVIGLVPIESDGSAHFRVSALRSISLNVLGADGKTLMRMGSDMHVMPGESVSCIGCHENRQGGIAPLPQATRPIALKKPPVVPRMPDWGTGGLLDYQKVVQPVWDKYCVECHSGPTPDGHLDMTGDRTRFFCMSYDNLIERDLVNFDAVFAGGHDENAPLTLGAVVSPLCDYIDSDEHSGHQIPREDRMRVYHWIDANVPYYATYDYTKVRGIGARDSWETNTGTNRKGWLMGGVGTTFERRCLACHQREINNQGMWGWLGGPMTQMVSVSSSLWTHRGVTAHVFPQRYPMSAKIGPELRINLTRPTHSSMLQAPLAEAAGGWGLCKEEGGSPVFADKDDADYQRMRLAIEVGKARLYRTPRVDMPFEHVEEVRKTILDEEAIQAAMAAWRPRPEFSAGVAYLEAIPSSCVNLAHGAEASSPDDAPLHTNGSSAISIQAAIDGAAHTYWDDIDGAKIYRLRVDFPNDVTISALSLTGWAHHNFAPKSFRILGDDREIGSVRNVEYDNNQVHLAFPRTTCRRLQLDITASYGGSPAIRELCVFDLPATQE